MHPAPNQWNPILGKGWAIAVLLLTGGAAVAQPAATPSPLVSPCVPLASAQAVAGADVFRWQQLYANCLAEIQYLREEKTAPHPVGFWQILPPPALQPAY